MYIVYVFDLLIAFSYFAIPLQIAYFTVYMPLQDYKAKAVCMLFTAFITLCGLTHTFHAFQLDTAMQIVYGMTATVSLITATGLVVVIPHMLTLPIHLEEARKQEQLNLQYRETVKALCDHMLPVRDDQLMNVGKLVLRRVLPKRGVQVMSHDKSSQSTRTRVLAKDSQCCLVVDHKVYQDNKQLCDELSSILTTLTLPPQALPGVDRGQIV